MKTLTLDTEIKVLCVTATSFPDGVEQAFEKLHDAIPFIGSGRHFGISRPNEHGVIVYKAAVEELQDSSAKKTGCESFVIQRGRYIYIDRTNFMTDLQSIGSAFNELLSHPGIDPNGYCLEWYLNEKDVRCLVKLDDQKN